MIEISFTIHGNHENEDGNPIAKARFTRRQYQSGYARRYTEWLDYVRASLLDKYLKDGKITRKDFREIFYAPGPKPLFLGDRKAYMGIIITFAKGNRPDGENVFGSIADALFHDDKNVAGLFDFRRGIGKRGKVDVLIVFGDDSPDGSGEARSRLHTWAREQMEK